MKRQTKTAKTKPPYIFEYYNVLGYCSAKNSATRRVIARVLNSIIQGLNTRERLPCFLIVILDKDVIEDVDMFDYGVSKQLCQVVRWLVKQIEIVLCRKRLELSEIKPGSAYKTDPKIVLVSMPKRPLQFPRRSRMEDVVSLRSKFNVVPNEVANEFQCSVLDLQSCDERHFDFMGKLNQFGMFTYWKELNHYIELFDKKRISLAPISHKHARKSRPHSAHHTDCRSAEYHCRN